MDVLVNLFRTLMFFFDNVIYSIIPIIYKLLLYLAQVDIFSTDAGIQKIMTQIYTLLGIFMLFKLAFSFLQYIINPDSVTEESKGIGKLVKNTLVVIVLLVTVPYIFHVAANLQYAIIRSNVIGELLLGTTNSNPVDIDIFDILSVDNSSNIYETNGEGETAVSVNAEDRINLDAKEMESAAKDLQFLLYGSFYSLNTKVMKECDGTPIFGSKEMAQNDKNEPGCLDTLEKALKEDSDVSTNGVILPDFFKYVDESANPDDEDCNADTHICDKRNFGKFDKLLWWRRSNDETGNNEYVINYLPGISAAAGIYVVFLLITFCIDIAVRAIKLCFLQMIAPISIVSYIDPKESSKNSKLGAWAKECGKTYVSLFIRLAVIFLIIRLISIIASGVLGTEGFASRIDANEYTMWIYLFLILGAFAFAKQVPKLLENLLGMKSTGELSLNPIKSITGNAAASALIGGTVGAASGFSANAINLGSKIGNAKGVAGGFRKQFLGVKPGEFTNKNLFGKAMIVGKGTKNLFSNTAGTLAGGTLAGAYHSGKTSMNGKIPEGINAGHQKVLENREARDSKQKQSMRNRISNVVTKHGGVKNEFGDVGNANKVIGNLQEKLQQNAQIQGQLREKYAETLTDKGFNYNDVRDIHKGVFSYDDYIAKTNNNELTKEEYNKLSFYDRYSNINEIDGITGTIDISKANDFNDLMSIQENINSSVEFEKSIKKQIKENQNAAGIKEDKK